MKILIGGAWPYANYKLHLGHIAGLVGGDVLARYHRAKGDDVIYVSGSDCHGTPIIERAKKEGITPKDVCEKYHANFVKAFNGLNFSYDLYTLTNTPYHHEKVKEIIRKILLIISIIGIVCSSGYLVYDLVWMPHVIEKKNEEFKVDESDKNTNPSNSGSKTEAPPIQEKYAELKNKYSDFAGKLIVKGLNMDFPVAQYTDNSYYLKYTFDKVEDKHGALFVDYRDDLINLSHNTIIYGHNMRDGTQFGMLSMYKKLSTYKSCPVITFNTIYKDYKWKVFAAFLINTKPEDDNGYVFNYTRTEFASDEEFNEFYKEALERSYFTTDIDVTPQDKILTLSTCSLLIDDSRFVVMARLVRDDESESVDTSNAKTNPKQRVPQAWYDEKKQTNPYVD